MHKLQNYIQIEKANFCFCNHHLNGLLLISYATKYLTEFLCVYMYMHIHNYIYTHIHTCIHKFINTHIVKPSQYTEHIKRYMYICYCITRYLTKLIGRYLPTRITSSLQLNKNITIHNISVGVKKTPIFTWWSMGWVNISH